MRIIFGKSALSAESNTIHTTKYHITFTTNQFNAAELWQMQKEQIIRSFSSSVREGYFCVSVDAENVISIS